MSNFDTAELNDIRSLLAEESAEKPAPAVRAETPKGEIPKVEVPKVEIPKVEMPKVEVPAVEPPRTGQRRV